MSLDASTLYLVATLVAALLGVMLLVFGRQEKIRALKWWGAAYVLGSASVAASRFTGSVLDHPMALALSAVGFLACGMVWGAARIFHGRSLSWPGVSLGAWVWLVVIGGLAPAAAATRMIVGAAIVTAYVVLTAHELRAERRKAVKRPGPCCVAPALHGIVLMLPILLGAYFHGDDAAFADSIWATVFMIELVLYAVGTVFVIFMLVSERAVRTHKVAASIDPLTGVLNRRGFAEATARAIAREAGAGRPVTVMILDIDHFKSINDRFGHAAGDEVLRRFAGVIAQTLRVTDLCGRIGGEEFAVLLSCATEEAMSAAERVRQAFASSGIVIAGTPVETTVSIGVACSPVGAELDVLLAAADAALYQAKRAGRNRVRSASDAPEQDRPDMAGPATPASRPQLEPA
ncbi:MAG: GGDEF domain-containing protein [Xanthobacteraceae bacterium]|nr:GGDEF domain-containing protein [Xanthobacteraceae bacterium]